jgi:hypothetical protein
MNNKKGTILPKKTFQDKIFRRLHLSDYTDHRPEQKVNMYMALFALAAWRSGH